jgi:heptosyltransferase-3
MKKRIRRILLIRTDRIGDVVLTTPMISLLHQEYPEAKLYFLTRKYTAPLLKHYRYLDEIIIYDPDGKHRGFIGHLKLSRMLRMHEIDSAFLFFPTFSLAFALRFAGIKYRVGMGYRWYSFLLNKRIFEHRKFGLKHELEYNLSLIKNYIIDFPTPDQIKFDFQFDETLKNLQLRILEKNNLKDSYLMVHPGSGGSSPNLPPKMFSRIFKYLSGKIKQPIFLVGNESEKPLINQIAKHTRYSYLIKIIGDWDLESYMAMIAGSKLFISNSTGPLHIARAFDIPLLAFYCPAIPCSPRRWGPYNQNQSVLQPDIEPCKTCNPRKCPHGNCLESIKWEDIRKLLDKRLNENALL